MPEFALTHSNDRARISTVIDDPVLVQARLDELHPDLQIKLLTDAIIGGLRWRNEATPASAPIAAGVQQWLKTVEDLRTLLASMQWLVHEQQNCPFVSSPDRSVSIVVMTGSAETGRNGSDNPTNQAEKGAVAEGFVQTNNQLELFNQESVLLAKKHQKETQVWALLYHYDKGHNEVRFELSIPTGFSKKKITRWGERLILGSISNNPAEFTIRRDEPNAPVTVDVEPKPGLF